MKSKSIKAKTRKCVRTFECDAQIEVHLNVVFNPVGSNDHGGIEGLPESLVEAWCAANCPKHLTDPEGNEWQVTCCADQESVEYTDPTGISEIID